MDCLAWTTAPISVTFSNIITLEEIPQMLPPRPRNIGRSSPFEIPTRNGEGSFGTLPLPQSVAMGPIRDLSLPPPRYMGGSIYGGIPRTGLVGDGMLMGDSPRARSVPVTGSAISASLPGMYNGNLPKGNNLALSPANDGSILGENQPVRPAGEIPRPLLPRKSDSGLPSGEGNLGVLPIARMAGGIPMEDLSLPPTLTRGSDVFGEIPQLPSMQGTVQTRDLSPLSLGTLPTKRRLRGSELQTVNSGGLLVENRASLLPENDGTNLGEIQPPSTAGIRGAISLSPFGNMDSGIPMSQLPPRDGDTSFYQLPPIARGSNFGDLELGPPSPLPPRGSNMYTELSQPTSLRDGPYMGGFPRRVSLPSELRVSGSAFPTINDPKLLEGNSLPPLPHGDGTILGNIQSPLPSDDSNSDIPFSIPPTTRRGSVRAFPPVGGSRPAGELSAASPPRRFGDVHGEISLPPLAGNGMLMRNVPRTVTVGRGGDLPRPSNVGDGMFMRNVPRTATIGGVGDLPKPPNVGDGMFMGNVPRTVTIGGGDSDLPKPPIVDDGMLMRTQPRQITPPVEGDIDGSKQLPGTNGLGGQYPTSMIGGNMGNEVQPSAVLGGSGRALEFQLPVPPPRNAIGGMAFSFPPGNVGGNVGAVPSARLPPMAGRNFGEGSPSESEGVPNVGNLGERLSMVPPRGGSGGVAPLALPPRISGGALEMSPMLSSWSGRAGFVPTRQGAGAVSRMDTRIGPNVDMTGEVPFSGDSGPPEVPLSKTSFNLLLF